jgi:hypothetical protein
MGSCFHLEMAVIDPVHNQPNIIFFYFMELIMSRNDQETGMSASPGFTRSRLGTVQAQEPFLSIRTRHHGNPARRGFYRCFLKEIIGDQSWDAHAFTNTMTRLVIYILCWNGAPMFFSSQKISTRVCIRF